MTKIASNLELMRKEWYNAFFSLNIDMLDYLEAEWFFSTNGEMLVYKKHQLRKLSLLKSKDPRSMDGIKRKEIDVHTITFDGLASITGSAEIMERNGDIRKINFIESWMKINDCWKLQFQTFEDRK
ncbi:MULTISPECIES: hypothetical protein [Serratia]|uniref:hypothetical protein n=1 Tax=Serratia TaxID=613 RepID=UPI00059EB3F7|nr:MULTISPECIES: hypothetical protein [Serratia]UTN95136.1 nuclear transport factor 2 family protein [Serratia plymuthica]VEA66753.1 Uncharacterised protein [Serratia plymuthica]